MDTPADQRYHAVRLLLPDAIVLLVSCVSFVAIKKVYDRRSVLMQLPLNLMQQPKNSLFKKIISQFGELFIILLIGEHFLRA